VILVSAGNATGAAAETRLVVMRPNRLRWSSVIKYDWAVQKVAAVGKKDVSCNNIREEDSGKLPECCVSSFTRFGKSGTGTGTESGNPNPEP
jgi:hypothetical protein